MFIFLLQSFSLVTLNVMIKCVAFSVHILEVSGSNLVWEPVLSGPWQRPSVSLGG